MSAIIEIRSLKFSEHNSQTITGQSVVTKIVPHIQEINDVISSDTNYFDFNNMELFEKLGLENLIALDELDNFIQNPIRIYKVEVTFKDTGVEEYKFASEKIARNFIDNVKMEVEDFYTEYSSYVRTI